MRSFFILTRVDLGFDPRNVLYFERSLPKRYHTDYSDSLARKNALTSQLLERFRSLTGVTFVSAQNNMPPLESERLGLSCQFRALNYRACPSKPFGKS